MATPEEKYEIITRRLQEVFGGDTIKAILDNGKSPVAYWGAAQCMLSSNIYPL
jgi:tyrosyl-tRNA synthetase